MSSKINIGTYTVLRNQNRPIQIQGIFTGTPTSLYNTTQQWDFPNAWPPLQAFIIQGLDRSEDKNAQQVAAKLADVWLRTNYKGFSEEKMMFEKVGI